MTSTAILIPARYYSSRFPGKPLCDLGGKTMIERVYDTCLRSGFDTFVLTDDERIVEVIGAGTIIDRSDYSNGTERCAGAAKNLNYERFINVQGDMPDITTDIIKRVNSITETGIATAWTNMDPQLQSDPNTVKIVHNNVYACWFGRGLTLGDHHLGIYGYTKEALLDYGQRPSKYEKHEGLEQLRWFEKFYKVSVTKVDFDGIEINTPEDMEKWNESR